MEDLQEKLDSIISLVKKSNDIDLFKSFLTAYIDVEINHVNDFLAKEESPDVRTASLCYEAMATAMGMKNMLSEEKDNGN